MNELIRVRGRVQNYFLSEFEKHPIIIPGEHHVTNLLVHQAHRFTLHGGPLLVQSFIYRQFCILRGRNLIQSIVRQCVKCTRYNAITQEQLMGPLSAVRSRPLEHFFTLGLITLVHSVLKHFQAEVKKPSKDMLQYLCVWSSKRSILKLFLI